MAPGERPSDARRSRASAGSLPALALAVALGLAFASIPCAAASITPSPPPPLPSDNVPGEILSFSSTTLTPGSSGTLSVTVQNPSGDPLNGSITQGHLELQVYRFAYEGSAQNLTQGDSWAVTLALSGASGGSPFSLNTSLSAPIAPGSSTTLSVSVSVPASAPTGSYFVRDRLNFTADGVSYVTASRGFFSDALWDEATLADCGSPGGCVPVLNLTLLGVSGVSPETSISVTSEWPDIILGIILGAAVALAVAAGYVAFRTKGGRGAGASSAGARPSPRRKKAATALGKSRSRDGD